MHSGTIKKTKHVYEMNKNEETVIFNSQTGEFFGVQDTSEVIWRLIDGTRTLTMIVNELICSYKNVSRDVIESDVKEMLEILKKKGLIA